MSASICWKTVRPPEGKLYVIAPTLFIITMKDIFGDKYPWVLSYNDIPKLESMAATIGTDSINPYREMINRISMLDGSYCTIEVWPEY